jgi:RNA recognition motif-containing protein
MIRMRADRFSGNIFVANLPKDFTDEQLAETLDPYGIVIGALIARDPATGQSKGCGLVNIAQTGAIERAIKGLNGTTVGGRKVEVREADPEMAISVRGSRSSAPRRPAAAPLAAQVITSRPRPPVQVEYRSLGRRA